MKLDTAGLQAFVAIVDTGTFHKAGEHLSLTQTAVSRRLQQLEAQLGVKLIDRTTRAWSLTPVGAAFLPKARQLVTDLEAAMLELRDVRRHRRGAVVIACVITAALHFLPDVLPRYARRYPGNRIKILDFPGPEVTDAVLQRRAEFGINVVSRPHPELETITVTHDPFVLMCRDDHALADKPKVRWRELQKHEVIALAHGTGSEAILSHAVTRLKLELHGTLEAQHASTALGLVAAGAGVAVLPSMTRRKGTYPRVRLIPLVEPLVERELAVIKRRGASLSPAAEALYEMVLEAFRNVDSRGRSPGRLPMMPP
jgi:DNA-binding transcriptional LysR family regulator